MSRTERAMRRWSTAVVCTVFLAGVWGCGGDNDHPDARQQDRSRSDRIDVQGDGLPLDGDVAADVVADRPDAFTADGRVDADAAPPMLVCQPQRIVDLAAAGTRT